MDKEFVNQKKGKKNIMENDLNFIQLSRYASKLESNMKCRMRKFALSISRDLVLECKVVMINSDIDIYSLVVYV